MTVSGLAGALANTPFVIFIVETLTGSSGYYFGDDNVNSSGARNSTLHVGYRNQSNHTFAFYSNDLEDYAVSGSGSRRVMTNWLPNVSNRVTRRNGAIDVTLGNSEQLTAFTAPRIGRAFGTTYYTGTISELIVYKGDIGLQGVLAVEGYLAWKWGIPISASNHPFYTFPPSSVVPFLPTDITGCQLWVDASKDTTSNTGYVSEIPDYSGVGSGSASFQIAVGGTTAFSSFYTTGGTANYYGSTVTGPVYTTSNQIQLCNSYQNGLSVYYFGANLAASTWSMVWGTSFTQFAVVKSATGRWECSYTYANSNLVDIDTLQSNTNGYIMKMGTYQAKDTGIAANTSVFTGRGNGTTGWNLVVIGYAAGATAASNYSINGTTYTGATTGSTAAQYGAITSGGNFVLNGNWTGSAYSAADSACYLAELIHYNGNLSAADRQIVEGYLMNKWRI
jgi:hypothetical protein